MYTGKMECHEGLNKLWVDLWVLLKAMVDWLSCNEMGHIYPDGPVGPRY